MRIWGVQLCKEAAARRARHPSKHAWGPGGPASACLPERCCQPRRRWDRLDAPPTQPPLASQLRAATPSTRGPTWCWAAWLAWSLRWTPQRWGSNLLSLKNPNNSTSVLPRPVRMVACVCLPSSHRRPAPPILPPRHVAACLCPSLRQALSYLHSRKVAHLDLKSGWVGWAVCRLHACDALPTACLQPPRLALPPARAATCCWAGATADPPPRSPATVSLGERSGGGGAWLAGLQPARRGGGLASLGRLAAEV